MDLRVKVLRVMDLRVMDLRVLHLRVMDLRVMDLSVRLPRGLVLEGHSPSHWPMDRSSKPSVGSSHRCAVYGGDVRVRWDGDGHA